VDESDKGQVSHNAAEVYEEFFVPALFQEWANRVADAAQVQPGQRVLDVACGTGVLAREISRRVGPSRSVVGLDSNEGMLAVARRKAPEIDWRLGKAEALPFEDGGFDGVLSQFGLMFFEDRTTAIKEMMRVLRPRGHLAVAVWHSINHSPGYAALLRLLQRLFGKKVANALRAPFMLGDTKVLSDLFSKAGVIGAKITTYEGVARFPSISAWINTDIKGWTLAGMLNDAQYGQLLKEGEKALWDFVGPDGMVYFPTPAHIVTATKP
jgi:ubiquinone/menaquinone biosynthesis C-methylase UbiE